MVRPCVRDDKPRAVSEWLSFVHTDEPYNVAYCTFFKYCYAILHICNTYCMVRPCARDDKPRAVGEWLSFAHTEEPYNKVKGSRYRNRIS